MTRVLLLFAETADPATAIDAALDAADASAALSASLGESVELAMITLAETSTPVGVTSAHVLRTRAAIDRVAVLTALRSGLSRFPAGRLLNSVGPVDLSRVFWRALRADAHALAMSDAGTVVIAADVAAARAASGLLRSGRAARAFWGLRGAVDELGRAPR